MKKRREGWVKGREETRANLTGAGRGHVMAFRCS